jgi:hypothetical protein
VARPALVLDVRVNAEDKKAALIVAYGTGVLNEATQGKIDLIIDDWDEVRALGLHKPPDRKSCTPSAGHITTSG